MLDNGDVYVADSRNFRVALFKQGKGPRGENHKLTCLYFAARRCQWWHGGTAQVVGQTAGGKVYGTQVRKDSMVRIFRKWFYVSNHQSESTIRRTVTIHVSFKMGTINDNDRVHESAVRPPPGRSQLLDQIRDLQRRRLSFSWHGANFGGVREASKMIPAKP